MKILITTLNSQYVHSNLAVKYLYSVCAEETPGIEIREYTINNDDAYVYGEIVKGDYDLVAFSCYIWNIEQTLRLAENLKKACPETKILLGGPEVSFDGATIMLRNAFIDYVISGEGEYAFHECIKALRAVEDNITDLAAVLPAIPSLTYRLGGDVFVNQPAQQLTMDSLPFPYSFIVPENDKIIYYESSRGCPRRCSYCLSSIEKSVRSLSMERIRRDIQYFLLKKVSQVKFIDRTFNYDRKRAYDILNYIVKNDNGVTNFHLELCADLIDDETVSLLRGARKGLFQLEIGVQSTNRDALSAVNRSTQVKEVLENIFTLAGPGNIEVHADLIAGLPFEDYVSFGKSFDNVYRTGAQKLHLGFLKLLKGTAIRRDAEKYGYVYRDYPPYEVISNKFISAKELVRLHGIEKVLDYYYNRGGFSRALKFLIAKASPKGAFAFYEAFSDYYCEKGYQHSNHRKEDLYRILNGFAESKEEEFPGIAEQARHYMMEDMREAMNFDAVKKFERKGWSLD
ncbi:MAG: B12-binding domain-containing radical SAM protein [Firmicutes bacterium]|nr:B12-binding domain-containing radical SAM protein [Bacillota bacterium]